MQLGVLVHVISHTSSLRFAVVNCSSLSLRAEGVAICCDGADAEIASSQPLSLRSGLRLTLARTGGAARAFSNLQLQIIPYFELSTTYLN